MDNKLKQRKSKSPSVNTEKEENKQEKNIRNEFRFKNIAGIISVASIIYAAINAFLLYRYQYECRDFYGIPGKYFSTENRDYILRIVVAFSLICIFVIVYKRLHDTHDKSYTLLDKGLDFMVIVCVGSYLGLMNLINLIPITNMMISRFSVGQGLQNFLLSNYVLIILFILSAVIPIVYVAIIKKNNRKIYYNIMLVFIFVHVVLMICGIISNMLQGPKEKREYEFLKMHDEEYVILSEYQGQLLLVEYDIDDKANYIFKTDKYYLHKDEIGERSFKNIGIPKIKR